jgi:hypothetical protein
MRLTLNRRPSLGGATIGELLEDGARLCYTLEDEIRERVGEPVGNWKIKGQTAIPSGTYRVIMEDSPRFGPGTLTLLNVPGFSYIRMHGGFDKDSTEGCLITGLRVTATTIVGGTSQPALKLVKEKVRAALASGQQVWIDINNPVAVA